VGEGEWLRMKVVCIASFKCTDDCVTGEQGQLYQLYHVQDRTDVNEWWTGDIHLWPAMHKYTVSRKKGATDFFAVTYTNIDGFS